MVFILSGQSIGTYCTTSPSTRYYAFTSDSFMHHPSTSRTSHPPPLTNRFSIKPPNGGSTSPAFQTSQSTSRYVSIYAWLMDSRHPSKDSHLIAVLGSSSLSWNRRSEDESKCPECCCLEWIAVPCTRPAGVYTPASIAGLA